MAPDKSTKSLLHLLISLLRKRLRQLQLLFRSLAPTWPPRPETISQKGGFLSVLLGIFVLSMQWRSKFENILTEEELSATKCELDKRTQKLLHLLKLRSTDAIDSLKRLNSDPNLKQTIENVRCGIVHATKEAVQRKSESAGNASDTIPFLHDCQKIVEDKRCNSSSDSDSAIACSDIETLLEHSEKVAACGGLVGLASLGCIVGALELRSVICTKASYLAQMLKDQNSGNVVEVDGNISTELVELVELSNQFEKQLDAFQPHRHVTSAIRQSLVHPLNCARKVMQLRRTRQLSKLWKLVKRSRNQIPLLAASSLLSIVMGSLESIRLYLHSDLIDRATTGMISSKSVGAQVVQKSLFPTVKALLVIESLNVISKLAQERVNIMGRSGFVRQLKADLFTALISKDLDFLESKDLWDCRFLIGSANNICSQLFDFPVSVFGSTTRIVTSAGMLYKSSARLSAAMAMLLGLRLALQNWLIRLKERVAASTGTGAVDSVRELWMMLVNPSALRTLRLYGKETNEIIRFKTHLISKDRHQEREQVAYGVFGPIEDLVTKSVSIFGVWYGSHLASGSHMRPSEVATFVNASEILFDQVRFMFEYFVQTGDQLLNPLEQMHDLMFQELPNIGITSPPIQSMPNNPSKLEWSVQFNNVEFAYPSRKDAKILKGVTFTIHAGDRVGVLGTSGGGKSSLLSLLTRLYDADKGTIVVGGKEVTQWNPVWLRQQVVVAQQSPYFPCSNVKENLLFAMDSAIVSPTLASFPCHNDSRNLTGSKQEILLKRVLELAHCYDLFFDTTRFPSEWYTDIGPNASKLSGGEKQRLGLAMSLLRNPRILCLDESTSALDEESQFQVQETLEAVHSHRKESGEPLTVISIAHRLSNFRHVDQLIVIDDGVAVEVGTPSELLAVEGGVFARYVQRQNDVDFGRHKRDETGSAQEQVDVVVQEFDSEFQEQGEVDIVSQQ